MATNRVMIQLSEEMHHKIKAEAEFAGLSVSAWISEACAQRLYHDQLARDALGDHVRRVVREKQKNRPIV